MKFGTKVAAVSGAVLSLVSAAAERPNVLLICVDDLTPVLGCYGGPAKTPNIDQLAKRGVAFQKQYVQWPVCGPSRASMLGGLRPDTTGIYSIGASWKIAENPTTQPVMPLHFKDNGYTTLSFGKVFHGKSNGKGYGWSEPSWHPNCGWTCYVNHKYTAKEGKKTNAWRPVYEIFDGADSEHGDCQTATQAIKAIRQLKDKPFFIGVGFYKPHLPFVAPKKYWDLYTDAEIRKRQPVTLPDGAGAYMYNWSEIWSYGSLDGEMFSEDHPPTAKQTLDMTHAYYACVSFNDAQVGRLLNALKENGLDKKTVVVLWGDHGFHLGDHARWAKHTQFENAMRSPLIIYAPGRHGIHGPTDALAESLDIYPTLCDYCGIPTPKHVEGKSLMPILEDKLKSIHDAAYSQIHPVGGPDRGKFAYSIRTDRFRYVEWHDAKDGYKLVHSELYDHEKDPLETQSVFSNPEYSSRIPQLKQLLKDGYSSLK